MRLKSIIITSAVLCLSVSALAACGKQNENVAGTTAIEEHAPFDTAPNKIALDETAEEESTYEWETMEAPDWDGIHRAAADDDKSLMGDELLESVLLGRHSFIVAENNELDIPGVKSGDVLKLTEFYALTGRAYIYDMIIVDVDGDGVNDAVLNSGYHLGSTLVFHPEGDKVYMWGDVFRGAKRFMTDGTFESSGGASDTHYYRLTFDGNKALRNELAYMTLKYSDKDNTSEWEYSVDGKTVSESEFTKYCEKREASATMCESVEFSENNIRKALGKVGKQETETFPKPDIKGTYNQSLKWDGSEHVKCAEDDKQLERNELFASVLGNRHSFVYRDAVNGWQTDINFKDGAELSMQEFNYILSLQNYNPTEFALVGLNGEGNNAVIIVAEKGVGNAYFLLYEYNGNAYMSVTMGRGTRNFKTNGAYIGTDDTAVIWQTDKDSAIMKHMAYFEIIKAGDDYKTIYYIAGKKVEQIEYEQYVEKWGSSGTDCEFVPLTDKNINKYLKTK